MTTDHINQTIKLQDGRTLGFAEYGDPAGIPVFHFHGSAGSRLDRPADESVLTDLWVRFISTDRPGHGLSDLQPDREMLDWPDDVRQLADNLGIDEFYVTGLSAGGPYALACAYQLPARVMAGAVVSTGAPPDARSVYRGLPLQLRVFRFVMQRLRPVVYLFRRRAHSVVMKGLDIAVLMESLPPEDRQVLETQENGSMFIEVLEEGYRQGWRGIAHDDILLFAPWGFRVEDVTVPIDIWHGASDKNWSPRHSQYLHERIPNSDLIIWPGQGHLALLGRWPEVLAALVE